MCKNGEDAKVVEAAIAWFDDIETLKIEMPEYAHCTAPTADRLYCAVKNYKKRVEP